MNAFVFSFTVLFGGIFLIILLFSLLQALWEKFWLFLNRKTIERDYMKSLRAGKDVEILNHDHEKILGIPIVECLHRKSMKRNVKHYSYNEKVSFVNPVVKLVDGKVVLVGGVVRRINRRKKKITAEEYLHYYDQPPKSAVAVRIHRKHG